MLSPEQIGRLAKYIWAVVNQPIESSEKDDSTVEIPDWHNSLAQMVNRDMIFMRTYDQLRMDESKMIDFLFRHFCQ